jgi:predicted dehydrogenase
MKTLRIGVVGVGHMGRLHARKLAELRDAGAGVTLSGVADTDSGRASEVAAETGALATSKARELFERSDALVVAVPTVAHHAVVSDALRAGLDVLVEKPIAATLLEAEALLALAREHGRVLQVGHLERFNTALRRMKTHLHRPRFVEAHRMGPFSARATDVDVVRDLMIHDIDLIQDLVGEEPCRVEAVGVPILSQEVDIANARLTFPGGCVANLTASRVSPTPMRKLRIFQADGYFSLDFLTQSVVIFRRVAGEGGAAPRIEMERVELDREDALVCQLRAFAETLRSRGAPLVSADDARAALRTALRVIEAMPPVDELR